VGRLGSRSIRRRISGRGSSTSILQAIVLGIVQGVTEFAPVSSSGHLILVPWLFNWTFFLEHPDLNKTFDVALHLGTFVGAVVYFRHDVVVYLKAWVRSISRRRVQTVQERIAWFLVIGTIPGVILGALFESVIEDKLGQPWLIAGMLAVFGVVLLVVDRWAPTRRGLSDMALRDPVVIGLAQAVALQPGVSRSGVTITAARGLGLDRESAARFSFLLSLPIIAGAGALKGVNLATEGLPAGTAAPFVWGMLASGVSGFLTIWGLLSYLRRGDFTPFVVYRLLLAAFVLLLIAFGVRPATIG
jgi:undecaprenyl-diphosphatase